MKTIAFALVFWICLASLITSCASETPTQPPATVTPTHTVVPTATTAPTPTITPTPLPVMPLGRGYHAMAYDAESKQVIVFGGALGTYLEAANRNTDTWAFEPATRQWKKMSPAVVPGGYGGGDMTYDSKADRVILIIPANPSSPTTFDYTTLQTWAYDYNTDIWTQMADGPDGRLGARIVYNSAADKIIMFGGASFINNVEYFNDTWIFDFDTNTWTQMLPVTSPEARNYHSMAYDPKADRTVMWGGDVLGSYKKPLWVYDYNTNSWEEITYEFGPTGRDYLGFAYDEKADRFVVFGGFAYGSDETWIYDLNSNTWQKMLPDQNPGVLSRLIMIYDKANDNIVMYGGQVGRDDFVYSEKIWTYDLDTNTWTNISPGQ